MIKSLIVPLIFGTLVVGIAGHGDDMRRVGRLAFRSIVYFEVVTTLALAIGLIAVNMVKPGVGVSLAAATADKGAELAKTEVSLTSVRRAHRAAELLRVARRRTRCCRSCSSRFSSRSPSRASRESRSR